MNLRLPGDPINQLGLAYLDAGRLSKRSHVTRHSSHVTRHSSHVTRHNHQMTRADIDAVVAPMLAPHAPDLREAGPGSRRPPRDSPPPRRPARLRQLQRGSPRLDIHRKNLRRSGMPPRRLKKGKTGVLLRRCPRRPGEKAGRRRQTVPLPNPNRPNPPGRPLHKKPNRPGNSQRQKG